MRYVLHIGTNKTGTSTLQDYLGTQRPELLSLGIWYPEIYLPKDRILLIDAQQNENAPAEFALTFTGQRIWPK